MQEAKAPDVNIFSLTPQGVFHPLKKASMVTRTSTFATPVLSAIDATKSAFLIVFSLFIIWL